MAYIRSKVRYNCFCKRKGNEAPDQDIVSVIEKQLGKFTWSGFTDEWDVAVFPDQIKVIPNVRDINRVIEVCTYAHIASKNNIKFDQLNDSDTAVVQMIESQFLEGKMTWDNFMQAWGVRWVPERRRIESYLLNVPSGQIEVTPELIQKVLERGGAAAEETYKSVAINLSKED